MVRHKCFCGGDLTDNGKTAIEDYTVTKLSALYQCKACSSLYIAAIDRGDLVSDYKEAKPNDLNDNKQKFISSIKRKMLLSSWKGFLGQAEGCTIVDFGCGDGNLALYINSNFPGNNLIGVDLPSRVPPLLKESSIGYKTISAFMEGSEKVDVILLRHVLEHIEEPVSFIQSLVARLNTGGRIIIEVPNLYSFWRRRFGKKWMGYYSPYHYWVYSQEGMEKLVPGGSKIKLVGYTNPPHGGYLATLWKKDIAKPFVALGSMIFYPLQIIPVLASRRNSEAIVYQIIKCS